MSILKGLESIEREGLISFHVPGHKNGRLLENMPFAQNIGHFDTTEIPGTDNLHDPEDIILEAQKKVRNFYGTKESFFLVNGTSCGIISMIYAAFQPGDKVIISRDAHKSVFTGMILGNIEPVYITPEVDMSVGLSLGVTKELVEEAYEKHDDIKGIVVTYPNYHGICTELEGVAELVHSHNGVLLVDGAHGAHLLLHEELPETAINYGGDIVVHSTHKSLPAFTQSSILHYCSERVSLSKLKMALSMFQSSSPSYLLMASLENAVDIANDKGRVLMDELLEVIEDAKETIQKETPFYFLEASLLPHKMKFDKTKMTLLTGSAPITGGELERLLREKYKIQCEYSTDSVVLFITSIGTSKKDLMALTNALVEIAQEINGCNVVSEGAEDGSLDYNFRTFKLKKLLKPSEAIHCPKILVDLEESIDQIAGEFIVPYPPGVPIVVPGEVISEQVVNYIEEGCRKGYNVNGVYFQKTLQVNIIRR